MKDIKKDKKAKDKGIDEEVNSNLEATKEEMDDSTHKDSCNCDCNEDLKDEKLKHTINELEEYKSKFVRLNAEFQNYKRRVEKEKSDIYSFGSEKIIGDILPILDNLERALESSKEEKTEGSSLRDGIQMIYKQFLDTLKKHGVEAIECVGEEFDPNFHHAVMQEENEESEENTVIEEFQKGYTLNSKVIRPSMVKVSN